MSKSFYKYIVSDLLIGWLRNNRPIKGSRYYIMVENDDHRKRLLEALKENSVPILVEGIFEGANIQEEGYDTFSLNVGSGTPQLIIGDDTTANEDYLTTLRNSVGQTGKYENYGVLYILSKSVLSSLVTASMNIEGSGGPLHPSHIVAKIKADVEDKIVKRFEQIYLSKHLDSVSELIYDGTASLFDFESMMTVLGAESIKGHFGLLDMFEDKAIYNPSFGPKDEEMAQRAEHNKALYSRVYTIMNNDDEDKTRALEKFLDEKLSKKVARHSNDWNQIDLQEFLDSESRKAATDSLQLLDVTLSNVGNKLSLVWNSIGKPAKSTKNYIVVCDQTGASEQEVVISLNKGIAQVPKPYKKSGNKILIPVSDQTISFKVGVNDNHHDFFIVRISCSSNLFKDISHNFSLNKKGEITVKVPDEAIQLEFGKGDLKVELPTPPEWVWSEDECLVIPTEGDNEEETIVFSVDVLGKKQKFTLKLNSAKPVPPLGPDIYPPKKVFHGIEIDGQSFKKVTDGEIEHGVYNFWRVFLEWEQLFLENESEAIELQFNELTDKYDCVPRTLALPQEVKDSLKEIFNYFIEKDTVPSLCPIDEELCALYGTYCTAVLKAVQQIPVGESMSRENHNLTRLGTLYDGNKLYLSPFHPLMVAYTLEYLEQSENNEASFAKKLLSPFYLIPYLTYKGRPMRPYGTSQLQEIRNWLVFEGAENKPQERANDITTKMVKSKMVDFIKNFSYLFFDKESPIVISCIGIPEDANLIKGIIEFIKSQYEEGVQRIELHEYVEDLSTETFFEKLNRLDSNDTIDRELRAIFSTKERDMCLESKGVYTSQDVIHQLFTRVDFYKHDLKVCDNEIGYCHIAFYQMATGSEYVNFPTKETRTELALKGLISIPSTLKKAEDYFIGFGTKGVRTTEGWVHPMTEAYNNLFGNERNDGLNAYNTSLAVTKRFSFKQSHLLESIYNNANWVTFLNPEVDINFFYQQDLYVVHYTDQYTINAKYDSITVTKHIGLYENILKKSYEKYALSEDTFPHFNKKMKNYFNCLNGSWMLRLVNQTEVKVREKMSLVATCIVMQKFLRRNPRIIWIPISLDEILRVTGEIGLKMESIFSKKTLGAKGAMSDDLLMLGLDAANPDAPILYFYPVEVKASSSSSMSSKGIQQVCHTWLQFKEHLFSHTDFETKIYRTFFASQLLVNSEKLYANKLISSESYEKIESCRYALLNLKWSIQEVLPVKEMGVAAVVSFFSSAPHSMITRLVENVPICEIHFSEKECFEFVADSTKEALSFLTKNAIVIEKDALDVLSSPNGISLPEMKVAESSLFENVDEGQDESDDLSNTELQNHTVHENEIKDEPPTVIDENADSVQPIQIVVGKTKGVGQEIFFEPNNTAMVSHPNLGIIGTMGTGKTQFARSLIAQFVKENVHNIGGQPVGLLIFDYKGDYKDKDFLETIVGESYKFNYPFNPLKLVINDEVEGMNLPAITADRIADSFAKAYGLGLKQQSNIKQVIVETYADAGITRDSATWNNIVPTMNQVIEKYFEKYDANDKAYALFDKLRDYTIFTTDQAQCVSMFEWLKGARVIDLTLYPDDTKKVIVSLILDLFYAEMRQLGGSRQVNGLRELRAMILVDEAHQFLKKDFNSFRSIISEGRMFGVGMILSTQNISDFRTNKEDYSQFILSWVIHHVNSISKGELTSIFGASDPNTDRYMDFINKAKIFESICKIGHKVYGIRDLPYFELIQSEKYHKE